MATPRTLHWVTKIGNLKKSLRFFEQVFGFRVLRHEEFESGCEATCNGPYAGAWSKTMVGWGPEETNFAFELTYNYGINGYQSGDDVQYFALACPWAVERAMAFGYGVKYEQGTPVIEGPDGFRYKIVPPVQNRAERFQAVVLKSSDVQKTEKYWCGVLGATKFPVPRDVADDDALTVGWQEDQVKLVFIQKEGVVNHAENAGRIANACDAVEPFFNAATKSPELGSIMNPPITLPTPGKADVVVTILADPDAYEICFVGDQGFYDLATPQYDLIDWHLRESRGADGAPPPRHDPLPSSSIPELTSMTDLQNLASTAKKPLLFLDFGAAWCKNCRKLRPHFDGLAASASADKIAFASVDVDLADDIATKFNVTAVPHLLFLDAATLDIKDSYVGSSAADIDALLSKSLATL